MKFRFLALMGSAFLLAACGGGSSTSGGDGIQLTNPSVSVNDVPATESMVVTLDATGETLTFTAGGTQTFSGQVQEGANYSLTITTQPTSTLCAFAANGNVSIAAESISGSTFNINCGAGASGGGGGPVSTLTGPFKPVGWTGNFLGNATLAFPVSTLDFNNNPLTGAGLSNFTFFEDDMEVVNSSEFPIAVIPMPNNNAQVRIAVALDISQSLSESEVQSLKSTLISFINSTPADTSFNIFAFDSVVSPISGGHTTDKAALAAAINAIDATPEGRDVATDLYGAINTAAVSAGYSFLGAGTLGYTVIITDGQHTATGDDASSTSNNVEDALVFGVGIGDGYDPLSFQTAIGDSEGAGQNLLAVSSVGGVGGALDSTFSRMQSFISGMHAVLYRSPRRDGSTHDFTIEATPLQDCAANTGSEDACGFVWEYDANGFVETNDLIVVPDVVRPVAGQLVTLRIPDWTFCSENPTYQWNVTENQGSATTTVIDGSLALQVQLGATTPIDLAISVDEAGTSCSFSGNLLVP